MSNYKAAKKAVGRVGLAMLWTIIAFQFLSSLSHQIFITWIPQLQNDPMLYIYFMTISTILIFSLPGYYLIIQTLPRTKHAQKYTLTPKQFLFFLIVCFGCMNFFAIVGSIFTDVVSETFHLNNYDLVSSTTDFTYLPLMLLYDITLAPILEELMYRKLIIDRLERYGDKLAIAVSCLAFGFMHSNLSQFFYAIPLGILLGYVYLRTHDLKYCIFLHMGLNFLGGLLPETLDYFQLYTLQNLDLLFIFLSIFLFIYAFIKYKHKLLWCSGEFPLTKKETRNAMLYNIFFMSAICIDGIMGVLLVFAN